MALPDNQVQREYLNRAQLIVTTIDGTTARAALMVAVAAGRTQISNLSSPIAPVDLELVLQGAQIAVTQPQSGTFVADAVLAVRAPDPATAQAALEAAVAAAQPAMSAVPPAVTLKPEIENGMYVLAEA